MRHVAKNTNSYGAIINEGKVGIEGESKWVSGEGMK